MPVFHVKGTTRRGKPFSVRFEAPAQSNLQGWCVSEQARVESVRQLPLTAWPFSRLPWMTLVFPVLCYGLYLCSAQAYWSGFDLWREPATRSAYVRLEREGVTVPGMVTAERFTHLRGARRRTLEYTFVDPTGSRRQGVLAPVPGDLGASRHDLRLLAGAPSTPGGGLTVTELPFEPSVNAPFRVDDHLLGRFDDLSRELRRRLGLLAALVPVLAWMVWNVLVRTGSHWVLSRSEPRLVLITRGENPFVELEEDEEDSDES